MKQVGDETPFGERLRQLRESARLTQEELAARSGLTAKSIAALERGRRKRPYPHTIQALADALGLRQDERGALVGAVPSRVRLSTSGAGVQTPDTGGVVHRTCPVPTTPIVGRERELDELVALIGAAKTRLITLTGPGGVGKTRLTQEVVARLAESFSDGVAFVTLAPLAHSMLVVPTIAQTLGLNDRGDDPARSLTTYLRDKHFLLALDNFEHVLPATQAIADLLALCHQLVVLANSRAPLRLRGEREYPVNSLVIPDTADLPRPSIMAASAVQLFVQRVQATVPEFELTDANVAAVVNICRRLDGLPLALELAAVKVRLLQPVELLARLNRALPVLTGGTRDLPERQRTMRATIDWSYQLLHTVERMVFRRLAIFEGGWTLAAAEVVGAGDGVTTEDIMDLLLALVEQSMVVADRRQDGSTRYRMLEPVREYARERLAEHEDGEATQRRYAEYFLQLGEQAEDEMMGPGYVSWVQRLDREIDNIRAVLGWSAEQTSSEENEWGLRLAGALRVFWDNRGHVTEGRRWLETLLRRSDATGSVVASARASALAAASDLAHAQGDFPHAAARVEESVALWRMVGDNVGLGTALLIQAAVLQEQRELASARTRAEEGVALLRATGNPARLAWGLRYLGLITADHGDGTTARTMIEEALTLGHDAGNTVDVVDSLVFLAQLESSDKARACALNEQAVAIARTTNDKLQLAWALGSLGRAELVIGNYARATAHLHESLRLYRDRDDREGMTEVLQALGDVALAQGDVEGSTAYFTESLVMSRELHHTRGITNALDGLARVGLDDGNHIGAAAEPRRS